MRCKIKFVLTLFLSLLIVSLCSCSSYNYNQKNFEDSIHDCIPGIVFWGDSLTERGLPEEFRKFFEDNIGEKLGNYYANNKWYYSDDLIPIVNMGVGSENSQQIAVRSGADHYIVAEDFIIPSDIESVQIIISKKDGSDIPYTKYGRNGYETISLDGIEGVIEYRNNAYYYKRNDIGKEHKVKAGTEVINCGSILYRGFIQVIFIGTNGGFADSQDLTIQQQSMLNSLNPVCDKYIIVGIHTGSYEQRAELEKAMTDFWGEKYINLREYLIKTKLNESNCNENDLNSINNGVVPGSMLSDGLHYTNFTKKIVAKCVYNRMVELGYFDEILKMIGKY